MICNIEQQVRGSVSSSISVFFNICLMCFADQESNSSDFAKPIKITRTTGTKESIVGKKNYSYCSMAQSFTNICQ